MRCSKTSLTGEPGSIVSLGVSLGRKQMVDPLDQ
jgi:hypothetical protein